MRLLTSGVKEAAGALGAERLRREEEIVTTTLTHVAPGVTEKKNCTSIRPG
jgi:hypothetical protein